MMQQTKRRPRRAEVDESLCVACGCCVKVCPKAAIHVEKGIFAQVDPGLCVGCGLCEQKCPLHAIEMRCPKEGGAL